MIRVSFLALPMAFGAAYFNYKTVLGILKGSSHETIAVCSALAVLWAIGALLYK
jgi:hypothetical protein